MYLLFEMEITQVGVMMSKRAFDLGVFELFSHYFKSIVMDMVFTDGYSIYQVIFLK